MDDYLKNKDQQEKYRYFAKILEQVETNQLYKGEKIEGNPELENQRERDLEDLKVIINNNMIADGINFIAIGGKKFKQTNPTKLHLLEGDDPLNEKPLE